MNILQDFKTIHSFISGIFSKSEKEYELTFVQDPDGRWYIDIPWDGERWNLEMVLINFYLILQMVTIK